MTSIYHLFLSFLTTTFKDLLAVGGGFLYTNFITFVYIIHLHVVGINSQLEHNIYVIFFK